MNKFVIAAVASLFALSACGEVPPRAPEVKDLQANKAAAAADSIQFTENSEIENIKRRLELTSKPSTIGFILLMNEMGQPVMYTSVKGKVTSGSKRLTAPVQQWRVETDQCASRCAEAIADAPSDEGTWGSSDPYIYFWTVDGQYIQWNGKYMYSDKPFRTKIEPLVINTK